MEKKRCPHMETCEMFDLFQIKQALDVWKTYYCEFSFERCERYQLSQAGHKVPADLLPNGKHLDVQGGGKR